MASCLLGLSFDTLASPSLVLRAAQTDPSTPASWGVAWYPDDDAAATAIKERSDRPDGMARDAVRHWERFRSTTFVLHTRGAAKRLTQQDAQPFVRSFARREIVFAHSGDLKGTFREALVLGAAPAFEPVGRTDSEHVFCWLLEQMRALGARKLADIGWGRLHGWLQQINAHGTANLLLTDGLDLVAYRDATAANPLSFSRRTPPFTSNEIDTSDVTLRLEDPRDTCRTRLVFATAPADDAPWVLLDAAQMLVARKGQVAWNSKEPLPHAGALPLDAAREQHLVSPQESLRTTDRSPHMQPFEMASAPQGQATTIRIPALVAPEQRTRILEVTHETIYKYSQTVESSAHVLRLQPVWDVSQQILDYELTVNPGGIRRGFEDVFGNQAVQLKLTMPYEELSVRMRATIRRTAPHDTHLPHDRPIIPLVWMPWQRQLMHAYLLPVELPETQLQELSNFAMSFVKRQDYDLIEALRDVNRTIYQDFTYESGSTTLETTPFDVYASRRGVCQDFANLFICMARLLGVPARYRVGYIYTGSSYENKIQSDASHAWAEVYLPAIGWRGFDPTNGCEVGLDHIRVAAGRNYRDATPTSGTIFKGGGTETLIVSVRVVDATP